MLEWQDLGFGLLNYIQKLGIILGLDDRALSSKAAALKLLT